jgi:nucleoside-diphosphate kinase
MKELDMERSLVLIKPDAMERGLGGTIISRLQQQGLKLRALKMLHVDEDLAKRHYAIHKDKPFFNDLVEYITSVPIIACVFEGKGAIDKIRKIMGATDPAKAEVGTIRADFGLDILRNTTHASDSKGNARKEIELFFTDDEMFDY